LASKSDLGSDFLQEKIILAIKIRSRDFFIIGFFCFESLKVVESG